MTTARNIHHKKYKLSQSNNSSTSSSSKYAEENPFSGQDESIYDIVKCISSKPRHIDPSKAREYSDTPEFSFGFTNGVNNIYDDEPSRGMSFEMALAYAHAIIPMLEKGLWDQARAFISYLEGMHMKMSYPLWAMTVQEKLDLPVQVLPLNEKIKALLEKNLKDQSLDEDGNPEPVRLRHIMNITPSKLVSFDHISPECVQYILDMVKRLGPWTDAEVKKNAREKVEKIEKSGRKALSKSRDELILVHPFNPQFAKSLQRKFGIRIGQYEMKYTRKDFRAKREDREREGDDHEE